MKDKLKTVMRACNPNSTQAESSMVKFQGGKLIAYGGTFCLQIPISVNVECAFKPETLLNFYRKDRTGVAFTVKDGKLRVRHGKETVTLKCLPPEKMGILDVINEPMETKWLPKVALKALRSCIDSSHRLMSLQGLCIADNHVAATDGKVMISIPLKMNGASFTIPTDTVQFLASCEDPVTHYAFDEACLKLWMKSGMTLCTRLIVVDDCPNMENIFSLPSEEITMGKQIKEELLSLNCDSVEISQKGIRYLMEDGSEGTIRIDSPSEFCIRVNKKLFDIILNINVGMKFFITDNNSIIIGNGNGKFRSACSLLRLVEPVDYNKEVPF